MTILNIKNLSKKYKNKVVLNGVDLELTTGIYGLIGVNGSGKTTLFRAISGLVEADYDCIELDGNSIGNKEFTKKVGYLPQNFQSFKDCKVYEVLHFFCNLKGVKKDNIDDEIVCSLKKTHMEDHKSDKIKTLSGGMLRRVGIAQALLGEPKLILLDEPTVGLDIEERKQFWSIIKEFSEECIVIISTHLSEDVENHCDKVISIRDGEVSILNKI